MTKFHRSMVTNALVAEEAMRDTPIAAQLAANGFTPDVMAAEAKALSDLRTQVQMAKAAMIQASAALAARSAEFATKYASYTNLVRGFTPDPALRRKHGVKSLGSHSSRSRKRTSTLANATPTEPTGSSGVTAPVITKP